MLEILFIKEATWFLHIQYNDARWADWIIMRIHSRIFWRSSQTDLWPALTLICRQASEMPSILHRWSPVSPSPRHESFKTASEGSRDLQHYELVDFMLSLWSFLGDDCLKCCGTCCVHFKKIQIKYANSDLPGQEPGSSSPSICRILCRIPLKQQQQLFICFGVSRKINHNFVARPWSAFDVRTVDDCLAVLFAGFSLHVVPADDESVMRSQEDNPFRKVTRM